ncbi:MAG: cupin domain-containing protein [Chitinophagales bacterium]|nr:cupin domain-containing protein [Bacteroidota bacterium]MBK9555061.1 cupin domain-containing protein [Bacteroidota bacterium]
MQHTYPLTIQNCIGERLTFTGIEKTPNGDRVLVTGLCKPGAGPAMHVHFKQDESLTVVSGQLGYQVLGKEPQMAGAGETILFKRGTPHKFWAANNQPMEITGWIEPAHSVVYFLSALYAAQNKSGNAQPDPFDGAYLITRYKTEYDIAEVPGFVKKVIFPITVAIGKLLGKYKHFKDAPEPLK